MNDQNHPSPFTQQTTPPTTSAYVQYQRPNTLYAQSVRSKEELPQIAQEVAQQPAEANSKPEINKSNNSEKTSILPLLIFPVFILLAMSAGVLFSDYLNFDLLEKKASELAVATFASNTTALSSTSSTSSITWLKVNNTIAPRSDSSSTEGRIPLGLDSSLDGESIKDFDVIYNTDKYMLWYSASSTQSEATKIYYASSIDGYNWEKENTVAQLELGESGSGDDLSIYSPSVVLDSSEYKMYYVGKSATGTTGVYLATSTDGVTWSKANSEIADASSSVSTDGRIPLGLAESGDDLEILDVSVVKTTTGYHAWYSARNSQNESSNIFYATSPDGLSWTKYNNKLPTSSDSTSVGVLPTGTKSTQDSLAVSDVEVYGDSILGFTMFYNAQSYDENRVVDASILCAVSSDGINWYKINNSFTSSYDLSRKCVLSPSVSSQSVGDSLNITSPEFVSVGTKVKLMYVGDASGIYTAIPL